MDAEKQTAITVIQKMIRSKEEEIINLKKAVNDLCGPGEPIYPNLGTVEGGADFSTLRSDQFYGQTIYGAARQFLEMRKAGGLGAASVNDIYAALRKGGFKFEAKDDENAKNGLRVSLRKQSTIFHRLPNGDYGLLAWYPKAKPPRDEDDSADAGDATREKPQAKPHAERSAAEKTPPKKAPKRQAVVAAQPAEEAGAVTTE